MALIEFKNATGTTLLVTTKDEPCNLCHQYRADLWGVSTCESTMVIADYIYPIDGGRMHEQK